MTTALDAQRQYRAEADRAAEDAFGLWWQTMGDGTPYKREYEFHATVGWRFDYAFIARKVAVEIDGVWGHDGKSRHTNPVGYMGDMDKLNAAAIDGWCVLRFPAHWLNTSSFTYLPTIYEQVQAALDARPPARLRVTADSAAVAGL